MVGAGTGAGAGAGAGVGAGAGAGAGAGVGVVDGFSAVLDPDPVSVVLPTEDVAGVLEVACARAASKSDELVPLPTSRSQPEVSMAIRARAEAMYVFFIGEAHYTRQDGFDSKNISKESGKKTYIMPGSRVVLRVGARSAW